MKNILPLLAALGLLSGCDLASDIAGEVIAGELRTQYLEQCQGVAEGVGIASQRIGAACECSADQFAADLAGEGAFQIDQGRIEQVLRTCLQEQGGPAPEAPVETTNG